MKTTDTKSARKAADTRQRVLQGARRAFFDLGYEGASMADIAKVAAVSKGTLYTHFPDKRALFAEVVEAECSLMRSRHFVLDDSVPLEHALLSLGIGFIYGVLSADSRCMYRTLIGEAHRNPELGVIFMNAGPEPGAKSLAALLDAAVARGELAIPDTLLAAFQFINLCDSGLTYRVHMGKAMPPHEEIERHVRSAVSLFLKGYAAS